ncbi:hypothetical protein THAOC_33996 [Thalassiosira oceanica]|uniref:Uncharacterized protein n=1 Tax=Thalassiosira oceanica TaxID=159749 RepID=K0R5X5_THAOC|nr:hypothetical protein THAOC_33996 [Thalassiosira oceanica]|eukprot:EJK47294.1 hypothetical protein THAOC_33996 [Thalassiosira oceanica]
MSAALTNGAGPGQGPGLSYLLPAHASFIVAQWHNVYLCGSEHVCWGFHLARVVASFARYVLSHLARRIKIQTPANRKICEMDAVDTNRVIDLSANDNIPLPAASAPMALSTGTSEPKQPPELGVNVDAPIANEPGRLITPVDADALIDSAIGMYDSSNYRRHDLIVSTKADGARFAISLLRSKAIDERAGAAAEWIYGGFLKPERGWFHKNGDDLHTYTFIPGSLKGLKNIKAKGVSGVHYAIGELELCKMIQTYGLDHAPKDLEDIPDEPDRYSNIYELRDWVMDYLNEMEKEKDASKKAKSSSGTSSKRKRGSRPVNLSDQAAKKSKPAAGSQTSKDIAVVSRFFTERDNKILMLKAELEAQKTLATCEKDKLKKKLDEKTNEVARLRDELARKDGELAQTALAMLYAFFVKYMLMKNGLRRNTSADARRASGNAKKMKNCSSAGTWNALLKLNLLELLCQPDDLTMEEFADADTSAQVVKIEPMCLEMNLCVYRNGCPQG